MKHSTQLDTYVKVFKDALPKDMTASALVELETVDWKQHSWRNGYGKPTDKGTRQEEELSVYSGASPCRQLIMEKLWHLIRAYIEYVGEPQFDGWAGFTGLRFNKYEVGQKMEIHIDHIKSMFDGERKGIPILSIVGALNDDYEGGVFTLWDNYEVDLSAGDVLIFPSCFLYPHKVTPVTKGTRHTFVSWVW